MMNAEGKIFYTHHSQFMIYEASCRSHFGKRFQPAGDP